MNNTQLTDLCETTWVPEQFFEKQKMRLAQGCYMIVSLPSSSICETGAVTEFLVWIRFFMKLTQICKKSTFKVH